MYSVYEGYEGWYDADAGETEMRIYDNDGKYPLWLDLEQYAERLAQIRRIMDMWLRIWNML